MDKKTEALKLALEALEWINRVNAMEYEYQQKARESLNAIYEALAEQPAQPSKPWVGLTDVEIASACKKHGGAEWWWRDIEEYGRAIEAKLKEKNT